MGIYGALATAVSGLTAQAFALENISGNIANVQTTGFKRVDTSFVDLVDAEISNKRQNSGSVVANSRSTNSVQGDITASQVETHAAVNGDGYFVIQEKTGEAEGRAIFGGVDLFSRRGDFSRDDEGYLRNGAGYYLKTLPIDPVTGAETGSVPELVQFQDDFLPAEPTTTITYRGNLAQVPVTAYFNDPSGGNRVPGSELLAPAVSFPGGNPRTAAGGGVGFVAASDEANFLTTSIAGGAITAYEAAGAPVNVQFRWAKVDSARTGIQDQWNLFYLEDSLAAGATPKWRNVGADYVFDASGTQTPVIASVNLPALTVDGVNLGAITLSHGVNSLTQYDDPNGNATTRPEQDGRPAGELISIQLADGGFVTGSYDNGQTRQLARIPLVSFTAEDSLARVDGGAFSETFESGQPIYSDAGQIQAQSLENSNTDISEEFTKLIITQQAYSANSRVISTSDEMLQDVLSILR